MTTVHPRSRTRRRSPGWVPNQHGAWAMLAAPLFVGTVASGPTWVHLPLAAFWFTGYFAFFATGLWLKARRRDRWFPPVRVYVPAAMALGLVVLAVQPELVRWAPAFVLPLGVGLVAAAQRHERDLVAGLTTVTASGLIAVVAYDAGTGPGGSLDRGWLLAAIQFAYFAGTVFYVKSAIRERGNTGFLRLSVGVHLATTLAMGAVSPWLVGVFALLTLRAAVLPGRGLTPGRIGVIEVVATVVVSTVSLLVV